jgi:polyisoprenyl-phosphate glycosyltransferase|tara:strand:- start:1794 stop:2747 length:954 start_codon:yes stop_codon:yes gene_type:complete
MSVKISVVIPCFNESENINKTFSRIFECVSKFSNNFELIFVDDGSSDDSFSKLYLLSKQNKNLKIIKLSKNFGHQNAIFAGLENSSGDCIFTIDADLQDPPELFEEMYEKWKKGFHVVYGIRKKREGNFFKKLLYGIYHKIFKLLSNLDNEHDLGDFGLIDKKIKNHLIDLKEKNIYFRGLRNWIGFKQTGIEYKRYNRLDGKSKYSLLKLYNLALNGITNFSSKPLTLIFLSGLIIFILSIFLIVFYLLQKIYNFEFLGVFPDQVPGFYTLVIILILFGSFNLMCMGIMGEYIGRLYEEVKSRPKFYVDEKINFDE